MANANENFQKIEEKCSNAYLLDETLCLLGSLGVINSNFNTLSSAIVELDNVTLHLNSVFNIFQSSSAKWIGAFNNLNTHSQQWDINYLLVNQLSSTWNQEFTIYYTKTYEINDWKTKTPHYSSVQIKNWLDVFFPVEEFPENQYIRVFVNLYENFQFDMTNYRVSYYHDCHAPGGTAGVLCNQCPQPSRSCVGGGASTNTYDYCGRYTVGATTIPYTCRGNGANFITLPIGSGRYNFQLTDYFPVRVVNVRYYREDDGWVPTEL